MWIVALELHKFCGQRRYVIRVTSRTTGLPETDCQARALGALHSPPRVKQGAAFRTVGASPLPAVVVRREIPIWPAGPGSGRRCNSPRSPRCCCTARLLPH